MAGIDSRAVVTCNLGPLISGGVNDSYTQNAGLVFTKGQVTLKGAMTPTAGDPVTFTVAGANGVTQQLKRSLVVLSSFADPFKGITEVSIGCPLTYKDGVSPAPGVTGEASYLTPRMMECMNGLPASAFVPPIFAMDAFKHCVEAIGMAVPGNVNLKNPYVMDRLDLSGGYVSVIADLLLSEGKCGYCDELGRLQVLDLTLLGDAGYQGGGNAITLDRSNVIELAGINSGELAPGLVVVPYISKKLSSYKPDKDKWDEVETVENVVVQTIDFEGGSIQATHTPVVFSRTEYGDGPRLNNQCRLSGGGFGDLSDKPILRINTRTTTMGVASPSYCSALLSAGLVPSLDREGVIETRETTQYDGQDRPAVVITETYEPMFVYAGRLSLPWVFEGPGGVDVVQLSDIPVLTSVVRQEFEYVGNNSTPGGINVDQSQADKVVFERRIQRTYEASGITQGGNQSSAEATTEEAFASSGEVLVHISNSQTLILTDVNITTQKRFSPQGQGRPGESDRAAMAGTVDQGGRKTKYAEVGFKGNGSSRVVQYQPPLMPESYFTSSGSAKKFDTKSVAVNYGRVQHRLAVGNRLGLNIQTMFDLLNQPPLATIALQAGGFVGRYAANGTGFTFSAAGAIASSDALFLGGLGYTGIPPVIPPGPPSPSDPDPQPIPEPIADRPWYPLPDDYPIDELPSVDDGQLIPPFVESVNVLAGVALGVKAASAKQIALEAVTVSLGVAIGLDGTNGTIREKAFAGVAIGVEAISERGMVQTVEHGVAVGLNVAAEGLTTRKVSVGVAIGTTLGPAAIEPLLLLPFNTDFVDTSSNGWTPVDDPAGLGPNEYPQIIPSEALPGRFGSGSMYRPYQKEGCKVYDFGGSPQSFGTTWTLEFWLYLFPGSFPLSGQDNVMFSTVGADGNSYYFSLKTQDSNEMPWLAFNECMSNGWLYYPAVEGPTSLRLPAETWTHCAFVAEVVDNGFGGTDYQLRIYQGGLKVATGSITRETPTPVNKVAIGGILDPSDQEISITGNNSEWFMDELRLVIGKAVYTGESFTPPTGAF